MVPKDGKLGALLLPLTPKAAPDAGKGADGCNESVGCIRSAVGLADATAPAACVVPNGNAAVVPLKATAPVRSHIESAQSILGTNAPSG